MDVYKLKTTHQNFDATWLTCGEIGTHPKLDIHAGFQDGSRLTSQVQIFLFCDTQIVKEDFVEVWTPGSFASHPMAVHPQEPRDRSPGLLRPMKEPQGEEHVTFKFHCSQFGV